MLLIKILYDIWEYIGILGVALGIVLLFLPLSNTTGRGPRSWEERGFIAVLRILLILFLCASGCVHVRFAKIPNITGKSVDEGRQLLIAEKLELSFSGDPPVSPEPDSVISGQFPAPGELLLKGGSVQAEWEPPPGFEDTVQNEPAPDPDPDPDPDPAPEPAPVSPPPDPVVPGITAPDSGGDAEEAAEASGVPLADVARLREEKVYQEKSAITNRKSEWTDCVRFGSKSFSADGNAVLVAACDQKYGKFTAEFSPLEDFDVSEAVILSIYGVGGGQELFREEYPIGWDTMPFCVELDVSGVDNLWIQKTGDYGLDKIMGQFINDHRGMGVLMREAFLYPAEP